MTNGNYGAYGGYTPQQSANTAYTYPPKKKMPMQYLIIIILIIAIGGLAGGYLLGFFGPAEEPKVTVSTSTLVIVTSIGQSGEATFTLSNPTNVELSTSIDATALPNSATIDKTFVTLAPGQSETITVTATPTSSQSTMGFIYFSNSESFISVSISLLPPPSVRASLSKTSTQIYQGDNGNLLVTLKNEGQSTAFNTSLLFTGVDDEWLSYDRESFELEAGAEKTILVNLNIPPLADDGSYELIMTVKGQGFSQSLPFNLVVLRAVGILQVTPDEITGSKTSGEVVKLSIINIGNAELTDIELGTTGTFGQIASFSTSTISKLIAGQSTEVGVTLSGTKNKTYTGSIEVNAVDTYNSVQSQIVTASVNLE